MNWFYVVGVTKLLIPLNPLPKCAASPTSLENICVFRRGREHFLVLLIFPKWSLIQSSFKFFQFFGSKFVNELYNTGTRNSLKFKDNSDWVIQWFFLLGYMKKTLLTPVNVWKRSMLMKDDQLVTHGKEWNSIFSGSSEFILIRLAAWLDFTSSFLFLRLLPRNAIPAEWPKCWPIRTDTCDGSGEHHGSLRTSRMSTTCTWHPSCVSD